MIKWIVLLILIGIVVWGVSSIKPIVLPQDRDTKTQTDIQDESKDEWGDVPANAKM